MKHINELFLVLKIKNQVFHLNKIRKNDKGKTNSLCETTNAKKIACNRDM